MRANEIVGSIIGTLVILLFFGGMGYLLWTCTDGYDVRLNKRRAWDALELKRARREMELDLKLKEWQATASLEDLARHRERLAGELDKLHAKPPEGGADE